MASAAAMAALGLNASTGSENPFARKGRSPFPVELPEDPSPDEIAALKRRWGFWMDAPEGYV